jgi:hypothetical protein
LAIHFKFKSDFDLIDENVIQIVALFNLPPSKSDERYLKENILFIF